MTKSAGDGGVKRHHARTDLTPMPPPGPGESAPAMEVTPSQVEMEVVVPPPLAATPGGEPEGGVMATQAMPVSPGRHENAEDLLQPVKTGEAVDIVGRPVTPGEVAPQEWPPRAATPPPPPAPEGNGTRTTPLTMDMIVRQVKRVVGEVVTPLNERLDTIVAVNDALAEEFGRVKASLDATINGAVDAAKAVMFDEAVRLTDERLGEFLRRLHVSLDERFHKLGEQQASDISSVHGHIGNVRDGLGGEIGALRNDVSAKASRAEVDSLSVTIGSLRGNIAASCETVNGLKNTDDARREALNALNDQVHELVGTMGTFEGRINAVEEASGEARRELEALRQADTGLNAEQTRLATRVRGIEQAMEEFKGSLRGIREEALPEVRKAAIRAEQAAAAASAQMARLLPRLEYVEGLAVKMRPFQNFMDRVGALERYRDRHSADIADVAEQVGLNELADELRGALPSESKE